MLKFLKQLLIIDLYKIKPQLFIYREEYYKTQYGRILTLIIILINVGVGIYFLYQLLSRNTFSSYISLSNPEVPIAIDYMSEKFNFAIGIEDPATYDFIMDESLYTVNATYKSRTLNSEGKSIWNSLPLEIEECKLEYFSKDYQPLLKNKLNRKYCVKTNNYKLFGTFHHDSYSYINLEFYACDRNDKNKKCKSQEEMEKILNRTFLSLLYTNKAIDQANYKNPTNSFIDDVYTSVGLYFYKELHIYLKEVVIKSDNGLLFNNVNNIKFIQVDNVNDMMSLSSNESFCKVEIKLSNNIETYERKYLKIYTTLANFNGIRELLVTVGTVLSFFYLKSCYRLEMINNYFSISTHENSEIQTRFGLIKRSVSQNKLKKIKKNVMGIVDNDNKDIKKIKTNNIVQNNNNSSLNQIINNSSVYRDRAFIFKNNLRNSKNTKFLSQKFHQFKIIKPKESDNDNNFGIKESCKNIDIINKKLKQSCYTNIYRKINPIMINKSLKIKVEKVKLSFIESNLYYICFNLFSINNKKKDNLLFKKGSDIIKDKLDIINLLHEITNLERLEKLILTRDQLLLFQMIYKPILNLQKDENTYQNANLKKRNEYYKYTSQEYMNAFVNVYSSSNINQIGLIKNIDIINSLDYNMLNYWFK